MVTRFAAAGVRRPRRYLSNGAPWNFANSLTIASLLVWVPCSMGRPSRRPTAIQAALRRRRAFGSGGARKYRCDQTGCGGLSVVEQPASLIGALNYRTTSRPTSDKASKRSLSRDCGRDAHYCAPSAQNRTCSFPAYGSHLGCLTASLGLPYALWRQGHAFPALCPARVASVRVLLGLRPSLHRLRRRSPGLVRGFIATMAESDFSCPCIIGFGSSPSRCGPVGSAACGQT